MIMKNIFKLSLFTFLALGLFSCEEDSDTLTGNKVEGGLLENVTGAITYAQGALDTESKSVSLSAFQGNEKIESVDVYKQYFGKINAGTPTEEMISSNKVLMQNISFPLASQHETISFDFGYSALASGLTFNGSPMSTTDDIALQIGDYWELTYVAKLTDGSTAHLSAKKTKVTVACGSFLAGSYTCVTTRLDNPALVIVWPFETITATGDGAYITSTTGRFYSPGADPGTGAGTTTGTTVLQVDAGFNFSDVCGSLTVTSTNLGNAYTNAVSQSAAQKAASFVDPVTGVITIEYSIGFSGNTVFQPHRNVYTPN